MKKLDELMPELELAIVANKNAQEENKKHEKQLRDSILILSNKLNKKFKK